MNLRRLVLGLSLGAFFAASAGIGSAQFGPNPEVPLPVVTRTPATPAPTDAPSAGPKRGKKAALPSSASPEPSPADTPEPPQFTTIDGVWEIELQPLGAHNATYAHVTLAVTGGQITGTYQFGKNAKVPLTGAYDGRLIQLSATTDAGPVTFSGYVENNADMVGMFRTSPKDVGTAFTGQHRKKEKGGP